MKRAGRIVIPMMLVVVALLFSDYNAEKTYAAGPGESSDEVVEDNLRDGDGWRLVNGKWKFFVNGVYVTGWKKISGIWFYFDLSTGYMHTGWLEYRNNWFYFEPDSNASTFGNLFTGWLEYQNHWYYFVPNANASDYGQMVVGWRHITVGNSQHWYYFNTNGTMKTSSWLQYNNHWYYFNDDGEMVTGWNTINEYTYYFNSSGAFVNSTRRALLVGDGFYSSGLDLENWDYCFSNMLFGGNQFSSIQTAFNPNETGFFSAIESVMSGASESDITYLCITCRGTSNGGIIVGSGTDPLNPGNTTPTTITGLQLKNALDAYNGKVVLFLCFDYSGLVITRGEFEYPEMEFLSAFTEGNRSGELLGDKYVVICSSRYNESSITLPYSENVELKYSPANWWWMKGGGWDPDNGYMQSMGADSNGNSKVTLTELYAYSNANITDQHVVVHANDSNFTLFARTNTQ